MHPDEETDRLSVSVRRDWLADEWVVDWFRWRGDSELVDGGQLRYDAGRYDAVELERIVLIVMKAQLLQLDRSERPTTR